MEGALWGEPERWHRPLESSLGCIQSTAHQVQGDTFLEQVTCVPRGTFPWVFTAALFRVTPNWTCPKCVSAAEWMHAPCAVVPSTRGAPQELRRGAVGAGPSGQRHLDAMASTNSKPQVESQRAWSHVKVQRRDKLSKMLLKEIYKGSKTFFFLKKTTVNTKFKVVVTCRWAGYR